jgi:predicted alpha-1,6-mannanase (GH76 family)
MTTLITCAFVIANKQAGAPLDFGLEANRLTEATIATFFDSKARIWKPPIASAEAVGRQGYTFWPSLLGWQAIIEAAKVDPKTWKPRVATYYDALEQYFDLGSHAYCAWTYFPGNDDHFYDDNTWAVIACMEAYDVTGRDRYRQRAIEILEGFVKGGWDDSGNPGGMRWGTKPLTDRSDRTVSATAAGALAALLVAKTHDGASNRAWAKRQLDWIRDRLSAPSGLIYDGFKSPTFSRMDTIWTYNTGVPIRAALEYFAQTKDRTYREWAIRMGDAALDRSLSPLFDGAVKDTSKRYWYDGVYFVQYLVDGLRALSQATGDGKYIEEARRNARYCFDCLRDTDGLYWRSMRLWTIDSERTREFYTLTGQNSPALLPDASERSMEPDAMKLPTEKRPMAKTLLGNAGAARMFWMLAH